MYVRIATSMITKVNKSFQETIIIILSVRLGSDESTSPNHLSKCIVCSASQKNLRFSLLLVAYAHYIICHALCAYYCKKILR